MRIKRRKYRTLAFAYKTAGLLWGLVHVCAVVGFLTDWTQPLLYAGIGLFSLLTVNACIGGCWRAEARADRLTRQIAEKDKQPEPTERRLPDVLHDLPALRRTS